MAQPPFQTDAIQIEPSSGDTLTIDRDPSTGGIRFTDPTLTGGISLQELAGLNTLEGILTVGVSGSGALYTTIQAAIDAVPITATKDNPYVVIIGPGLYSENLTIEKNGIVLWGSGGVTLTAGASAPTITVQKNVTTTPEFLQIQNMTLRNPYTNKAVFSLVGGANSTVCKDGLKVIDCTIEATGVGSLQISANTVNKILVQGGSWADSSSSSSINLTQVAEAVFRDIEEIKDVQLTYSSVGTTPNQISADYSLINCGKVGEIVATVTGNGSLVLAGCPNCENVTLNGDRTHNFTASRILNLTLNDTTTAQLLGTSLLVAAGAGTLLIWDGSSFAPPGGGGGGGGEANTASNVGIGGVGVYASKLGVNLQFKNLNIGSNKVSITDDVGNNEIDIDVVEGNIDHDNISNVGINTHTDIDNHIADVANPHTVTAAQLSLGNVPNLLTNLVAVADPIVTDDSGSGYAVGSLWVNTATGNVFVCVDASVGAAVWVKTTITDHTNLSSIGVNTHAVIDTHLASVANPHSVTKTQVGLANVANILDNNGAVADPTINDDSGLSYSIGSKWLNIITGRVFTCIDNSVGAAVWRSLEPTLAILPPTVTDDISSNYFVGSRWVDTALEQEYVCVDNSIGAAVWVETTERALQGLSVTGGSPSVGDSLIATSGTTAEWAPPPGAAGGEANTVDNVGVAGIGVFNTKVGVELQFNNIEAASDKVTVALNAGRKTVQIDVDPTEINHGLLSGAGVSSHAVIDAHIASTSNPHSVSPTQVGNSIAQWNANKIQGVTVNSNPPAAGYVLTADDSSNVSWQEATGNLARLTFKSSEFLTTTASDWAISATAPEGTDTNNNSLLTRSFTSIVEQGLGFYLDLPTGSTQFKLVLYSRAEVLPGALAGVAPKFYIREITDNGAVGAWQFISLTTIALPTNEFWQRDEQTLLLTAFAPVLTAGKLYQCQLTRNIGDIADTLVGDWNLLRLVVEVD